MKNNLLKYYITAVYLFSTFVLFAQPGDTSTDGLETDNDVTPAAAPIDDYVWVLALIAIVFVFLKFRAIQNEKLHN